MPRTKVNLAYLEDDSARKTTFKKRKSGLMKKADELSTLCGVEGCVILYNSYDPQPNVWPAELEARSVLERFANIPDVEQSKRMMTQETFTTQMFTKVQEQVVREQKQNERKKMTNAMFPCLNVNKIQNLSLADLNEMGNLVVQNLRDIERSIKFLHHEKNEERKCFN